MVTGHGRALLGDFGGTVGAGQRPFFLTPAFAHADLAKEFEKHLSHTIRAHSALDLFSVATTLLYIAGARNGGTGSMQGITYFDDDVYGDGVVALSFVLAAMDPGATARSLLAHRYLACASRAAVVAWACTPPPTRTNSAAVVKRRGPGMMAALGKARNAMGNAADRVGSAAERAVARARRLNESFSVVPGSYDLATSMSWSWAFSSVPSPATHTALSLSFPSSLPLSPLPPSLSASSYSSVPAASLLAPLSVASVHAAPVMVPAVSAALPTLRWRNRRWRARQNALRLEIPPTPKKTKPQQARTPKRRRAAHSGVQWSTWRSVPGTARA
ncbi:hypothetical protein BC828DRAFT_410044 [Blastocladiella britannica]|nr:hypothetical protein BC828DRAFT_410044 [Blastocladiella britannica]